MLSYFDEMESKKLFLQRCQIFYSATKILGHSGRQLLKELATLNTRTWFKSVLDLGGESQAEQFWPDSTLPYLGRDGGKNIVCLQAMKFFTGPVPS